MIKKIYIAGPLFNKHEQMYLEDIAKELEGKGYDCFLPHRDQPADIDESEMKNTAMLSQESKDKIFKIDLDALDAADLTVALLSGQDIDSGTSAEIGYTYAQGKPVIGIDAFERRYRNLFVEGMITKKVNKVSELLNSIKDLD
jgi:nucleoside 2-deoxyribosyltransferase